MREGKAEVPAPDRLGAIQGSESSSSESADLHLHQARFVSECSMTPLIPFPIQAFGVLFLPSSFNSFVK